MASILLKGRALYNRLLSLSFIIPLHPQGFSVFQFWTVSLEVKGEIIWRLQLSNQADIFIWEAIKFWLACCCDCSPNSKEQGPVQEYNCFLSDLTQGRTGSCLRSSYNEQNMLNLACIISAYMSDKKGMEILWGN